MAKTRYVKRRPLRRKRRQPSNKAVVKIVKRELHRNIENKQVTKFTTPIRVSTSFPSTIQSGMYSVIPDTYAPTGVDNLASGNGGRIGQQLKPLSLRLSANYIVNSVSGDFSSAPIWFDMYVFKIRKIKDSSLFDSAGVIETANFFRPTATAGADTFYTGAVQNWYQNINTDVIQLLYKKRIKMAPTAVDVSTIPGYSALIRDNTCVYNGQCTVPLSKHLPSTLRYTNFADTVPNNSAIFATMVATKGNAGAVGPAPSEVYGNVSFMSTMVYEDA